MLFAKLERRTIPAHAQRLTAAEYGRPQRYNFQFGGQLFYAIKDGKITEQIEDVAYQSNTQEFWNSCVQIAGQSDYRMGGTFFDGKGQPPQVSAVSHGCPTSRFNNVSVINTARKAG